VDILMEAPASWEGVGECYLIVSNPPYITAREATAMEHNVLDWEPHRALFVPDNDPLLFYRAIARYAQQALEPQGWLYFEINPLYADELHRLLDTMGYHHVETKKDQYGKQRMIRAQR
jgi:release factor glutamine methyltransferase